jgi:hypothetical protein
MSYLATHSLEKSVPALEKSVQPVEKTAQPVYSLEKRLPARTLEETAQATRALEAMKAVDAFRPARVFTRTLPGSRPVTQLASEATMEQEPVQQLPRSSHQEKGKGQAALYSGSPACSVGTGLVTPV